MGSILDRIKPQTLKSINLNEFLYSHLEEFQPLLVRLSAHKGGIKIAVPPALVQSMSRTAVELR